jgi:hypothetical protein
MDANASINNLFNGNSLFGPQFGALDSSLPSIALNQPQDARFDLLKSKEGRFKPSGPEVLNVTVEYEGRKEDKFIFKALKVDYDGHGHLLLAPIIDKIRV